MVECCAGSGPMGPGGEGGTVRKLTIVVLVGIAGAALWWWRMPEQRAEQLQPALADTRDDAGASGVAREAGSGKAPRVHASGEAAQGGPAAAEKAARVETIKRDYDEMRAKLAADYAAAGTKFPGGLNGFLKQLALLEREKRKDYAAFLTARELEDVEYRETSAGQKVGRLLEHTGATEEQLRAVFRRQLAFDDRFALTFDLTPAVLLERETARQDLQREIRGVLGDELFARWLEQDELGFADLRRFAEQQGLGRAEAFGLWEVRQEFVRRRLQLRAQETSEAQRGALEAQLVREMQARVVGIVGPQGAKRAEEVVMTWLRGK